MSGVIGFEQLKDRSVRPQTLGLYVRNGFAGTLSKGTPVYISSAYKVDRRPVPTVNKADANAAAPANVAEWIVAADITNGGYGWVTKSLVVDADTSGYALEGVPTYLSETAGAVTPTAPTSSSSTVQVCGYVIGAPATAGNGGKLLLVPQAPQRLPLSSLDLTQVVDGAEVANVTLGAVNSTSRALAASEFGVPVQFVLEVGDVATGNVDFTGLPYKLYITDVQSTQVGGGNAGNSATLHNGITGNAITDGLNNATDTGTDRAATLHATHRTVAANATLRVAIVKAGGASSVKLTVTALRIA